MCFTKDKFPMGNKEGKILKNIIKDGYDSYLIALWF